MLFITIVLGCLLQLQLVQVQGQGVDLTSLLGTRGSPPIRKLMDKNLPQVQDMLDTAREECVQELNLPKNQRPLKKEPRPSEKEKCLLECVLKRIKMMDDNNRLSLKQVEKLTRLVTDNNQVAVALSCGLAQGCNRAITAKNSCDAAHQINQCIVRQLDGHRVNLTW